MYSALIIAAVTFVWGLNTITLPVGTVVVLASGSALETAIGTSNILNVTGDQATISGTAAGVSN